MELKNIVDKQQHEIEMLFNLVSKNTDHDTANFYEQRFDEIHLNTCTEAVELEKRIERIEQQLELILQLITKKDMQYPTCPKRGDFYC